MVPTYSDMKYLSERSLFFDKKIIFPSHLFTKVESFLGFMSLIERLSLPFFATRPNAWCSLIWLRPYLIHMYLSFAIPTLTLLVIQSMALVFHLSYAGAHIIFNALHTLPFCFYIIPSKDIAARQNAIC